MSKSASTSKADTAVKLVLVFFISLLSFSVGTYVGKQVSDSDARRAALEADYNNNETQAANTTIEDEATTPISDEEISTLAEEFVKKERTVASDASLASETSTLHKEKKSAGTEEGYTHREKAKVESDVEHAIKPAVEHAIKPAVEPAVKPAPEASKASVRVAHNMSPAADVNKTETPSTALPSVATTAIGKYTVQVASYASEAEAKDQATKLTEKGYSAFYIPATVNGKTWYRVSVGLFSDSKTATNYRTELLATQAVTTAIVQKIVK
ncbi:MAG: hypothetical protein A2Z20_10390 [Bdellovibrionales bacterium RBG_16_40_8]|nr:MAG: hypothetical protein A2Z20_10390 [Bdellovibrionales bacterium RBG_16_40_8]